MRVGVDVERRARAPREGDQGEDAAGDGEVDRRAGQRHGDLLARVARHRVEQRDAADRQQRDVPRADAVAAGRQRVAVFVQQHAQEQRRDQREAGEHAGDRPGPVPVDDREIGDEREERDMDVDVDPGEPAELRGPSHRRNPSPRPFRAGRFAAWCRRPGRARHAARIAPAMQGRAAARGTKGAA